MTAAKPAANRNLSLCGFSKEYFIGHDVELARSIADALGVEIEFDRSPKTFNAITDLVASEKADMAISLVSRTLSRAEKVRFFKTISCPVTPTRFLSTGSMQIATRLIRMTRWHR